MFGGLFKSTSLAALVAVAGIAVSGVSAQAADLGGNCCADLEERIAELEATTARKGNRKVSLTVSGQINQQILFFDDGVESNAYIADNSNSSSRFRFLGSAKINATLSAGFLLEVETISAASSAVTQNNDDGNPNNINVRHASWYIDSKELGRVTVGQTSPATDDIILIDTSGVGLFGNSDQLQGSAVLFRNAAGAQLAGVSIGTIAPNLDTSRRNLVRYDTPFIAGFRATATMGEDDFWDVGLVYAGELGGFKLAGGIGYLQDTEGNAFNGLPPAVAANANLGPDFNEIKGSASILHIASGLFLDGAFVIREFDSADRLNGNRLRADLNYYYGRAGIVAKGLVPLGNTIFYGEYADSEGGAVGVTSGVVGVPGVISQSDLQMYGFGIVQLVPAAAMEIYAGYKNFEADVSVTNGGVANRVNTQSIDVGTVGARIKF